MSIPLDSMQVMQTFNNLQKTSSSKPFRKWFSIINNVEKISSPCILKDNCRTLITCRI